MANFNYTLQYRTFDSLLADVRVDLRSFSLEGKIDPQQLIKIALKCNYDLGMRINMVKDRVLEVTNGRARLPEDFTIMNYALICGNYTDSFINPQGTNIEELPIESLVPKYRTPGDPVTCVDVVINPCTPTQTPETETPLCLTRCVDSCGNHTSGYQLVQKINTTTRHYNAMYQVRFKNSHEINCQSPNLNWMCHDEAFIKDGFVWFSTADLNIGVVTLEGTRNEVNGQLYINYEGALEDDEGNVLIPDHPMINEYYEYALKKRILENLIMDGEEGADKPYQLVIVELRAARNYALSICNTPNFSELAKTLQANRKAMLSKYYHMFSSFSPDPRVFTPINNIL